MKTPNGKDRIGGIYIPFAKVPKGCMGCEWRDAEAGGVCEFMSHNDYETYAEQIEHCPFKKLLGAFSVFKSMVHAIDADALEANIFEWWARDTISTPERDIFLTILGSVPKILPQNEEET